tara:strand:+ start:195 stop:386 length:192 start_codon:yes stop_codon:yes gene_type:complete
MAKKTKESKKAEPKKEVKIVEKVVNPWDHLGEPTTHPDHRGKDIYMKSGCHGYFDDSGSFIKV